jgi:SAM-dependent methyltransferase
MNNLLLKEKIKEYWNERAEQHLSDPSSTTNDIYLRELEIVTIIKTLKKLMNSGHKRILDVGCGEGYSTFKIAQACDQFIFHGIDYSPKMVQVAKERLSKNPSMVNRLNFQVGDVLDLSKELKVFEYDIVISDRCLINLESKSDQRHAIHEIAKHVACNGYYIAIENFLEGHEEMNRARTEMGLDEIPVRWHNLYFTEKDFKEFSDQYFDLVEIIDFSSTYYLATRVIYTTLCKKSGEKIDYQHPIHKLAVDLPWTGKFSPIRMAVLKRKSN